MTQGTQPATAPPVEKPPAAPAGPRRVDIQAGGLLTFGEAPTKVLPAATVEVDFAIGTTVKHPRGYAMLRILSLPGETADLANLESYNSAEVALGAYWTIPGLRMGVFGEGGWNTRLIRGEQPEPLERYPRHFVGGIRFAEDGYVLKLAYGRHQAAGDVGWGQYVIEGRAPLAGTEGAVVLWGRAILNAGTPGEGVSQIDIMQVGVSVSLPALTTALKGKPEAP
jgi:hypothetical protein